MFGERWNDERVAVETRTRRRLTMCKMATTEETFIAVLNKPDFTFDETVRQSFGSAGTISHGEFEPQDADRREALKEEWIDFLMTGMRACRGNLTDDEKLQLRSKIRPLLPVPGQAMSRVPSFLIVTDDYLRKKRKDSGDDTALSIVDRFHICRSKLRRLRRAMAAVNFDITAGAVNPP
jgi:hypothetical protein